MKKFLYALIFILLVCSISFAQTEKDTKKVECPDLEVTGPATLIQSGENQKFTISLSGKDFDEEKIKIKWSVDKGTIVSGQGTKTVSVSVIDAENTITVSVEVTIGECHLSGSESGITSCAPDPVLIDEFGKINDEDFLARMDAFMVELQNNPNDQGYIINYGSSKNIANREKFLRNHFNFRRFPLDRFVFVNGGVEKEIRTRLWRIPPGADTSVID